MLLAGLVNLLPLGYAFGAGVATALSPCGIAMFPAYVSLYLGSQSDTSRASSPLRWGARALLSSSVVTLTLVAVFGAMGVAVTLVGQFLMAFVPWAAVLIGGALVMLGIYLLGGGHLYTALPQRLAGILGSPRQGTGVAGFAAFGVAYGIAALSCTLPVFLVVVGSTLASEGFMSGLLQFVSFGLGMGFVVVLVTTGSALFQEAAQRWLRRLVPVAARLSGLLLLLAGGYILYYWFKVGDILRWSFY